MLKFEPQYCTLDYFIAEGTLCMDMFTAERLRRCRLAEDQLEAARVQQLATAQAEVATLVKEVAKRDAWISKLEADRDKAQQDVKRVLGTLEYVKPNFHERAGDGGAREEDA
jgi:hypothetical protein